MRNERLRVYFGPRVSESPKPKKRDTVNLALSDVFPLLADAVASERTWLSDFSDDEITISTDLYELILAYKHYHRPKAS
jgi:hypothetical protein